MAKRIDDDNKGSDGCGCATNWHSTAARIKGFRVLDPT
jgi:hypothetical protein